MASPCQDARGGRISRVPGPMGEESQGHTPVQLCLDVAGGGTAAVGLLTPSAQLKWPFLWSFVSTDLTLTIYPPPSFSLWAPRFSSFLVRKVLVYCHCYFSHWNGSSRRGQCRQSPLPLYSVPRILVPYSVRQAQSRCAVVLVG